MSGEHYENMPIKYTEIFRAVKIENFKLKTFDIFLIIAQNIEWVHVKTTLARWF